MKLKTQKKKQTVGFLTRASTRLMALPFFPFRVNPDLDLKSSVFTENSLETLLCCCNAVEELELFFLLFFGFSSVHSSTDGEDSTKVFFLSVSWTSAFLNLFATFTIAVFFTGFFTFCALIFSLISLSSEDSRSVLRLMIS